MLRFQIACALAIALAVAGCASPAGNDPTRVPEDVKLGRSGLASATAAAEYLVASAPFDGQWQWQTRRDRVALTSLRRSGSKLSGELRVHRSREEGGGTDTVAFDSVPVRDGPETWTFSFSGSVDPNRNHGVWRFWLTADKGLYATFDGTRPPVEMRLRPASPPASQQGD